VIDWSKYFVCDDNPTPILEVVPKKIGPKFLQVGWLPYYVQDYLKPLFFSNLKSSHFDHPTMMKIEGLMKVEMNTSAFTFNNCTYKERVDTQHFLNQWGGGVVGTICKRIIHWFYMFC
jgi:hypothetical protein